MNPKNIRLVKVHGVIYLHVNDVVELLNDFASSEETDVRNRLNELIRNIRKSAEEMDKYL